MKLDILNYHEDGVLYIGISDDRTITSLKNSDDIQKRIVDKDCSFKWSRKTILFKKI